MNGPRKLPAMGYFLVALTALGIDPNLIDTNIVV